MSTNYRYTILIMRLIMTSSYVNIYNLHNSSVYLTLMVIQKVRDIVTKTLYGVHERHIPKS